MKKSQEEGSHWICFLVILTHSVFENDKNHYLQVF